MVEAVNRHVSAPTLSSGNRAQRLVATYLSSDKHNVPEPQNAVLKYQQAFLALLRKATHASILCSFSQGLELIARASKDEGLGWM
jgi:6-phosphogluconate dehydrogenase